MAMFIVLLFPYTFVVFLMPKVFADCLNLFYDYFATGGFKFILTFCSKVGEGTLRLWILVLLSL